MSRKILLPFIFLALAALACNAAQRLPAVNINRTPTPTTTDTPLPPTPTATATPTSTPTPTPEPGARIHSGDQARFAGNWELALQEYTVAVESAQLPDIRGAALLGISRTYLQAGDYISAESWLQRYLQETVDPILQSYAYFALGQALDGQGRYAEAADAYLEYITRRSGVIDAYIFKLRADSLFAAGDYGGAAADYRAAAQSPSFLNAEQLQIRTGRAHAAAGDYGTALGIYQQVYEQTNSDFTKAQMDLLMGQAYSSQGQIEQAYQVFQDAVSNFPTAYDSYQALLVLVNDGVPVSELNRGIVDYYAGEFGVALSALDRYLQGQPNDPATALYYYGLTQRALGNFTEALDRWDKVIQAFPDHRFWDDAWEQKGYTQWFFMEDYEEGIKTLFAFTAAAPAHPRAAEFLFDAGLVAERDGQYELAAALFQRVADEYPADERTPRALFLSGLSHYRRGDFAAALTAHQRYLTVVAGAGDRAAGFFWQGKSQQALGDISGAASSWEIAAATDPTGYYSERARDLLRGRAPFEPPAAYDIGVDWASEKRQAEEWLRTTFTLPPETDLSSPGALAQEPRFTRGSELWELGLYELARTEFESLRLDLQSDAAASYRLGNHLLELGLYRSSILALRQVLNLAGMSDAGTMNAPPYFNHVRFGTYFYDLILPAAQEFNFHPLFLLSVIRQESAFEGFVRSTAGARGLMQIVPATGREIAQKLEWPEDYSDEDLYRPVVSVRMGASYLADWRDRLDGDLYAALAAYNGGPGNAMSWQSQANGDLDLFLEVVRFEETRNYIRGIYELYSIYNRIYERAP